MLINYLNSDSIFTNKKAVYLSEVQTVNQAIAQVQPTPQPVYFQPVQPEIAPVTPEAPVQPQTPSFCTNCGSPLMPGAKFCTNCGKQL